MTVKLYTKDGVLVHEQTLPAFVGDQPDVILWGDRIFGVPSVDGEVARRFVRDGDDDIPYEEAHTVRLDRGSGSVPLASTESTLRLLVNDASRLLSRRPALGWESDVKDWHQAAQPFVGH